MDHKRPAGRQLLTWDDPRPEVEILSPERVTLTSTGLAVDQPTRAEWVFEVEDQPIWLGNKWQARARIELRADQRLSLAADGNPDRLEIAVGPALVTVATRDLDVTDLVGGEWVSHRGDRTEHDVRIHVLARSDVVAARDAAAQGRMLGGGRTALIRTDFGDDLLWSEVVGQLRYVVAVDDRAYDGVTGSVLADQVVAAGAIGGYALLADARTMAEVSAGGEVTVDYVDLSVFNEDDEELFDSFLGRTFRCSIAQVEIVDVNLSIDNVDFSELADAVDEDGVYRGLAGLE